MASLAPLDPGSEAVDFIDDAYLDSLAHLAEPDPVRAREIIAKSMAKEPLSVEETAVLLAVESPDLQAEIFDAARQLKKDVYGRRIVLFAPLYIGSDCVNDCAYCAFKRTNPDALRRTLTDSEIREQVIALQGMGHRRTIIVFGEHPRYDADYIAHCVRTIYDVRDGPGEIRRVNVNAAPLDVEGFRTVAAAGIGVYQVFQETYHHATYARLHGANTRKGHYLWRLSSLERAMAAGLRDVGIGALFGLYDWRFEVLGLVSHAWHLQERCGAGPHTISFPRLQPALGVEIGSDHQVDDADFKRLIAILRLAVPYAGLICTARESAEVRRAVIEYGVSQIDAGTRIELGGYTEVGDAQVMEREQFRIGDVRPLDEVVRQLLVEGYIPSFCTACYRLGRTGPDFMDLSKPGFIQNFCTPNALSTLEEFLVDYASAETRETGQARIAEEMQRLEPGPAKDQLADWLQRIRENGERDLFA